LEVVCVAQICRVGDTVRDTKLPALSDPGSGYLRNAHYEQADLALQAAVLAHGIAETQPFIDANTPLVAMLTFLEVNRQRRARH
jgi:hypothetical protein